MLLADAKTAHARLQTAAAARDQFDEAQALSGLHKPLAAKTSALHALVVRAALLREYGVPLSHCPDFGAMRKTIANLRERFDEQPESRTLTKGKHWDNLSTMLDSIVASLDASQRRDWSQYFANRLFSALPLEKRKVGLLQTAANKDALEAYGRLYDKFSRYRNTVPANREALDDVHRWSDELSQIKFKAKDDVPAAVAAFIDATSLGASLRLLTPEVLDWLREDGTLENYVVRVRV